MIIFYVRLQKDARQGARNFIQVAGQELEHERFAERCHRLQHHRVSAGGSRVEFSVRIPHCNQLLGVRFTASSVERHSLFLFSKLFYEIDIEAFDTNSNMDTPPESARICQMWRLDVFLKWLGEQINYD
jgi:hypothetical protein